MYYFVEAFGEDKEWMESQFGYPESSDISDIEGWVLTNDQIKTIKVDVKIRNIPKYYQDCIEEFKTDYWDGEFTFEKKRWREVE